MKLLIIGFSCHPTSWFSKLIKFATRSKVSHSYVRVPAPEFKTSVIFQASGLTVNYTASDVFAAKNQIIEEYWVYVSDEQAKESEKKRVTEAGKPYSMRQIFGFLWVLGMRQVGRKVANPFANGNHSYVCVEIVADQIGLPGGESMTPEDLRRWCEINAQRVR